MGDYGLRRLNRIMKKLENIYHNLPHVDTCQNREAKIREKRGDLECIQGHTSEPKNVIWNMMCLK
jgi:hypothetical protein